MTNDHDQTPVRSTQLPLTVILQRFLRASTPYCCLATCCSNRF